MLIGYVQVSKGDGSEMLVPQRGASGALRQARQHNGGTPKTAGPHNLRERARPAVGRLGELLSLDTNTLTPLLKRLETVGLLTRQRSKADERRVMVALTEWGRGMQRDAAGVPNCIVADAGLPLDELTRLTRELRLLRGNLERAASKQAAR